jgi:hypothetical protein
MRPLRRCVTSHLSAVPRYDLGGAPATMEFTPSKSGWPVGAFQTSVQGASQGIG